MGRGPKALTSQAALRLRKAGLETTDVVKKKSEGKERVLAIRASIFVFISKSGMVCIFVVLFAARYQCQGAP